MQDLLLKNYFSRVLSFLQSKNLYALAGFLLDQEDYVDLVPKLVYHRIEFRKKQKIIL
jgi:hypothetical protein